MSTLSSITSITENENVKTALRNLAITVVIVVLVVAAASVVGKMNDTVPEEETSL